MLVQIVLFDGFDLLDALAPYEVMLAAGDASDGKVKVELVSVAGAGPVHSGPSGLVIAASGPIDLDRADVVLLPGAAAPMAADGEASIPGILAREAAGELAGVMRDAFRRPSVTVATVCGGSTILALSGLLEGRHAVSHHLAMPLLAPAGATPIQARVVDDGDLITGGGVTSGFEVSLHLVERFSGPRIAHAVERLFEYERRGVVWRNAGDVPAAWAQAAPELAAVASAASPAPAAGAAPAVAGEWAVRIATPVGEQLVTYRLEESRGGLVGTATQAGEVTTLDAVEQTGAIVQWTQHITKPMKLALKFQVQIEGDRMNGLAKAGILPSSKVTGVRLPARASAPAIATANANSGAASPR